MRILTGGRGEGNAKIHIFINLAVMNSRVLEAASCPPSSATTGCIKNQIISCILTNLQIISCYINANIFIKDTVDHYCTWGTGRLGLDPVQEPSFTGYLTDMTN